MRTLCLVLALTLTMSCGGDDAEKLDQPVVPEFGAWQPDELVPGSPGDSMVLRLDLEWPSGSNPGMDVHYGTDPENVLTNGDDFAEVRVTVSESSEIGEGATGPTSFEFCVKGSESKCAVEFRPESQSGFFRWDDTASRVFVPVNQTTMVPGERRPLQAAPMERMGGRMNTYYQSRAPLSYEMSDESVATVDAEGLVTAHQVGSTELIISADGADTSIAIDVVDGEPGRPRPGHNLVFDHTDVGERLGDAGTFVQPQDRRHNLLSIDSRGYPAFVLHQGFQLDQSRPNRDYFVFSGISFLAQWTGSGFGFERLPEPWMHHTGATLVIDANDHQFVSSYEFHNEKRLGVMHREPDEEWEFVPVPMEPVLGDDDDNWPRREALTVRTVTNPLSEVMYTMTADPDGGVWFAYHVFLSSPPPKPHLRPDDGSGPWRCSRQLRLAHISATGEVETETIHEWWGQEAQGSFYPTCHDKTAVETENALNGQMTVALSVVPPADGQTKPTLLREYHYDSSHNLWRPENGFPIDSPAPDSGDVVERYTWAGDKWSRDLFTPRDFHDMATERIWTAVSDPADLPPPEVEPGDSTWFPISAASAVEGPLNDGRPGAIAPASHNAIHGLGGDVLTDGLRLNAYGGASRFDPVARANPSELFTLEGLGVNLYGMVSDGTRGYALVTRSGAGLEDTSLIGFDLISPPRHDAPATEGRRLNQLPTNPLSTHSRLEVLDSGARVVIGEQERWTTSYRADGPDQPYVPFFSSTPSGAGNDSVVHRYAADDSLLFSTWFDDQGIQAVQLYRSIDEAESWLLAGQLEVAGPQPGVPWRAYEMASLPTGELFVLVLGAADTRPAHLGGVPDPFRIFYTPDLLTEPTFTVLDGLGENVPDGIDRTHSDYRLWVEGDEVVLWYTASNVSLLRRYAADGTVLSEDWRMHEGRVPPLEDDDFWYQPRTGVVADDGSWVIHRQLAVCGTRGRGFVRTSDGLQTVDLLVDTSEWSVFGIELERPFARPIKMSDGRLVIGGQKPTGVPNEVQAFVIVSDDHGLTWSEPHWVRPQGGNGQAILAMAEDEDGDLLVLMRDNASLEFTAFEGAGEGLAVEDGEAVVVEVPAASLR